MGGLLLRFRTWWETADRTQKSVTIFGGAFLAILLVGVFFFSSKPKMTPFLQGMTPAESGAVVAELKKKGIPFEYNAEGDLLVPGDKVNDLKGELAVAGKLPAGAHIGNSELSKLGMMETPSVEREKIKAILEGELATSIEAMEGVSAARVHITLGEQSPFASETKPATSSIFLTEDSGSRVGSDHARAIANMVANAVPGLKLENVFVMNSAGQTVFSGSDMNGVSGRASVKIEAEAAEAARRERELQATLDQSLGQGATIVKVNLELDFDDVNTESDKPEVAESPISIESAHEEMGKDGDRGASSGLNGLGAPTDGGGADPTKNKDYTSKQDLKQFAFGRTITKTSKALGQIKSMSIAVLANSDKKVDVDSVKQYLATYLGGKASDPNFKAEVTAVKFDDTQAKAAQASMAAASSSARMQQIFSLLPILAIVAVGFMVVKSITRAAKATNVLVGALPGGQMVALGAGSPALGSPASALPADSGEVLTGDTQKASVFDEVPLQVVRKRKVRRPDGEEEEEDVYEDVGSIKERMNKPLEQIKKLSAKKPETVAMLIKSWLLEEKK